MRFDTVSRSEIIRRSVTFDESLSDSVNRILQKDSSPGLEKPKKIPDPYLPSLDQLQHKYRFRTFDGKPAKKQIIWLPPLHRIVLTPFQRQFIAKVQLLEWETTGSVQTRAGDLAPKNAVVVY